eukprot:TRINITY_DN45499_c0_g1_i1.p1 TRINITY_DN45499_c0_g1~~TRINITY_DN45499_c0_g1_i1.p1  ORF type:complete len:650 (-),score=66.32 TRINITY_DN45499_c0_g1_i1:38-1696(-)
MVAMHIPPTRSDDDERCHVAFLNHTDLAFPAVDLSGVDFLFTDSRSHVPFAGRRGSVHFIERLPAIEAPPNQDMLLASKTNLLSILLPPQEVWDERIEQIYAQAQTYLPDHIFIDDDTWETHAAAFSTYRFSLIANSLHHSVSLPFVRSIFFSTIAVYNGFVEVGAMVFNGIADFAEPLNLFETFQTLDGHNENLGALWHYQRILQDQMQYRFNRDFEERLFSQACTLCRLRPTPEHTPPLVFVGIYSARSNFEKRAAVRETWGRILLERYGFHYTFFLGQAAHGDTVEEMRLRREIERHRDIVFLDVDEGYRMNSRKGLLFLQSIASRSEAEFLLKVDDDVYFRPIPILEQLRSRPPAQYAWGYWDYISPVPRTEGDHFFSTKEQYPFDVFAPYPRGVVRVLSMDLVRLISKAGREGKLRMIYGDDPCIGVHLRQLLLDPEEPLPSLTLDDFDNRVFAMEPSCHPNLWSKMTNRTWVIHHVSPKQIRCMWDADIQAGYYQEVVGVGLVPQDESLSGPFPDLCHCASHEEFADRTDLDELSMATNEILYATD